MSATFFWHDYETSGIDPALDRPMQFAGIRTDSELNVCDEPLRLYCKLAADVLPHPKACAVTGIAPQRANELGLHEREFIAKIHTEMSRPGTCSVGYNSIRFDDEFTRHILYRNFYDAYEREYKNGNSRWDLIDVMRLCCALRPDGIEWPRDDGGKPSFRLELLTVANGIEHGDAHDALADVDATIALARLIKQHKPRLFDYALQLRNKRFVAKLLSGRDAEPVLHVSSKLPAQHYCASLLLPVAKHPTNSNGVVCVDLRHDPRPLFDLNAEQIQAALFMPSEQRDESTPVIPLKTIHLNRSPMVATQKLIDEAAAQRIQLDLEQCRRHVQWLRDNSGWLHKLDLVFSIPEQDNKADVDKQLYGGGFFSDSDRQLMRAVRVASAADLREPSFGFDDPRLPELLFRYRARNFPDSLSEQEQHRWRAYCAAKLTPEDAMGFGFVEFEQALQELANESNPPHELIAQLTAYADTLQAQLS